MEFPITAKQQLILELLDTRPHREWYGLELIEASNGKLGGGTIYVHLGVLADMGFVDSRVEENAEFPMALPRRKFRITEGGLRGLQMAHNTAKNDGSLGFAVPEPA